ncbi:MAG: endo-1,4-beta-xylanase [Amphibacillus sp.]|uniref:Beta-xylanase n=1 Tax=Amphibacillus xylanus (strain ATCC 51415 / DSM 6626 / JCM 7361 / LMG 17667 / NBRC 15112 / Ep01) TaxID=698758 RepID=K0IZL9_AMPXN|nr:endo-1,4-beta-xylanase [Amphibacillus xylanus]NMA90170.1 endo-1,4-beta-xylanase [Amphibacillus sp.]BAM46412.1 endo-1,4-beta-xylanase [Amphibacillus xylanus NBRC 15112]
MKTLKEHFKDKFLVGAAVNAYTIDHDKELLTKHFNSITAENEMKPEHMQPEPNKFTFEVADKMIQFAEDNGMQLRGHTLVWHNQMPDWFFTDENGNDVSREELLKRMKDHITAVVSRYKGRIHAWDVVNEAVEDRGEEMLRKSKWIDIIGEDFIDYAFKFAHEADPDALLFYNDYNESHPEKREKIYQLVKGLLDRGVPIHGVGLQAHWNLYDPSYENIEAAIKRYSELGLQLHVTEMDVSVFEFGDERTDVKEPTKEMLHLQAERYERFFDLFTKYQEHITSVTFWGISDAYTWLNDFPVRGRKNWPFVLDEKGEPKPAYHRIVK